MADVMTPSLGAVGTSSLATMILRTTILSLVASFIMTQAENEPQAVITKTLYLIRHAESEENQRMQSLNTVVNSLMRFTLPSSKHITESLQLFNIASQVDSNVSAVGEQQILYMADMLAKEDFLRAKGIELVMHSPLQRARQTSKGLLQCLAANGSEEELRHLAVTRVVETPLLIERTPAEWMPGNYEAFQQRIRQWEDFVLEQPEERIAVVGHSQFFKAMLSLDFKFGNCHIWEVQLRNGTTNGSDTGSAECTEADTAFKLPPRWFGLKQLYECNHRKDEQ